MKSNFSIDNKPKLRNCPLFYNNSTIDETIERLESDFTIIIFWIFWVILITGMVFGFYYLDNRWLD